jgi:hypothetical protein
MTWNIAEFALEAYVELLVDITAMLAKTNVIPTTVTNSTSENPCSALLPLRCILTPQPRDKSRLSR